jgi:hypothetical protein
VPARRNRRRHPPRQDQNSVLIICEPI